MAPIARSESLALRLLGLAFFYAFGLFNWLLYLTIGVRSGTFFTAPTEQDRLRLAISRDRFWNLSKQPFPGFEHAFFKSRTGIKLHYLTNGSTANGGPESRHGSGNLFILLHGFPDTSMVWRHVLKEPASPVNAARIVCLDLPGYGGSDHFKEPNTVVLEAVSEFIVNIKEVHEEAADLQHKDFSTIVIAHDWGCAIGFRLAAEAPQLADRFVLSNGPHIGLSLANKDRVVASASKIFKQFKEAPKQNFGCLKKSFHVVKPLLVQVLMFGYIFAFHLPKAMVKYLGSGGHVCFLRGVGRRTHGKHADEYDVQEHLAATLGPGELELKTKTIDGDSYGPTVSVRAADAGEVFWHQTAYYRNGLALSKWEKSLELIADLYNMESDSYASISPVRRRSSSSASSPLFSEPYAGALRAPATILWGEKDLAVGKTICLDGIGDYLTVGSEVILLPKTGHWAPVEKESRAAIARAMNIYAAAGMEIPAHITGEISDVYDGVTSMVKK